MLPAGTQVKALPFGSQESLTPEEELDFDPYEGPTTPVTGTLEIVEVPADYDFNSPSYTLFIVDSVSVDPETIESYELTASAITEFYNQNHDEKGRFAPKETGASEGPQAPRVKVDPKDIRQWAKDNGFNPGDRGRLSKEIIAAHKKANRAKPQQPTTPTQTQDQTPESNFKEKFDKASEGISEDLKSLATVEQKEDGARYHPVITDDISFRAATEKRVTEVGGILHDEITSRLEKSGIYTVEGSLAEKNKIWHESQPYVEKVNSLLETARKNGDPQGLSLRELAKTQFPGTNYNELTPKQLDTLQTKIDQKYPGFKAANQKILELDAKSNSIKGDDDSYALAYRTHALQVLSEARGGDYGNLSFDKVLGSATSGRSTSKEVIESFQRAGHVYPDDWVADSNSRGYLYTEAKTRGFHTFKPNTVHYNMLYKGKNGEPDKPGYKSFDQNSQIVTSKDPGTDPAVDKSQYFPTSVHEMGHRMEELRPHIKVMEEAFFHRRTKGETSQQLKKLRPDQAYKSDEMAKPDKFVDPYIGKVYEGGPSSSYEIFTMGVQGLLGGSKWLHVHKDRDYASFILGLLATG